MSVQAFIGPSIFNLVTNTQKIQYSRQASLVGHDVVDAPVIYEHTGDAKGGCTIEGLIYPMSIGTNGAITGLEMVRSSGVPVPFILGNGMPMGWVYVDRIERIDEMLDDGGTGRKVMFSADLLWAGRPSGIGLVTRIISLLS